MKKIILLAIALFLSGCKAEYYVNLEGNPKENLKTYITKDFNIDKPLVEFNDFTYEEIFDIIYLNDLFIHYDNQMNNDAGFIDEKYKKFLYEKKRIDNNYIYGVEYYHNFRTNDYYKSKIINECFDEFSIIEENNQRFFKTNKGCRAFDNYKLLDDVKIIVDIGKNNKTIFDNADSKNGSKLIWNINRSNYKNKNISFATSRKVNNEEKSDDTEIQIGEEDKNKTNNIIYILVGIGLFTILVFTYVKLRKKY